MGRPGLPGLLFALSFLLLFVPAAGRATQPDQYDLLARATQLVQEDRLDEALEVFRNIPLLHPVKMQAFLCAPGWRRPRYS